MRSGVYKITFPSGNFYVGKSIDIETRWKQHEDKFRKGTAAKPMQAEWDRYKTFDTAVLICCHPDHIDLVEAFCISRTNPQLNTSRPEDPFAGIDNPGLDRISKWLHLSTLKHINLLNSFTDEIDELTEENEELTDKLEEASKKRTEEEINTEMGRKLSVVVKGSNRKDAEIDTLKQEIKALEKRIEYLNLPWWKRLF